MKTINKRKERTRHLEARDIWVHRLHFYHNVRRSQRKIHKIHNVITGTIPV